MPIHDYNDDDPYGFALDKAGDDDDDDVGYSMIIRQTNCIRTSWLNSSL